MSTETVTVLLADDQALVRAGLRTILERADDLSVVGEAEDGRAAVAMVRALRPQVAVLDVRMPVLDGIQAVQAISSDPELAHTRVLMLTTFDTDEHVFDALAAGAAGFLLKDCEPDELRQAVRTIASGDSLLAPSVTTRVVARLAQAHRPTASATHRAAVLGGLTEREVEVLAAVGRGLSNDEIAKELFISPATARTYVSRLLSKLGARDRVRLVVLAHEIGLS